MEALATLPLQFSWNLVRWPSFMNYLMNQCLFFKMSTAVAKATNRRFGAFLGSSHFHKNPKLPVFLKCIFTLKMIKITHIIFISFTVTISTLSIPEAGETAETPVKRYRNTGKVPIRTQKRPYPVRNYYFLLGYIHVFDKGNSVLGEKWTYLTKSVWMEGCLCFFSSNIQSEVGKQGSAIGFVHKQFVLLKICRKYEQTSCLQWLLETTVGHLKKSGDIFFLWQNKK